MSKTPEKPTRKLGTGARVATALATAVTGLSLDAVAIDKLATNNSQSAVVEGSLSQQLKHPLSPIYEPTPKGTKEAPGQSVPVGETISALPEHKGELIVEFGTGEKGSSPLSEVVPGEIPIVPANVNNPGVNEGHTPGAPKHAPPNSGAVPTHEVIHEPIFSPRPDLSDELLYGPYPIPAETQPTPGSAHTSIEHEHN